MDQGLAARSALPVLALACVVRLFARMQEHDTSWRGLLKRRGVARALLKSVLPPELAKRITGRPEILSESFVSDDLRASVADAVLRVRLAGNAEVVVYCVIEHKRTEERFALVQVLRYMTSIFEQQVREGTSTRLAPVLPVIIFNGEREWRGPTRFSDLLVVDVPTIDFEVVLMDLRKLRVDELSAHPTLRGGLLSLKAAATPVEELDEVLDAMLQAMKDDPSTLRFLLKYLAAVAGRRGIAARAAGGRPSETGGAGANDRGTLGRAGL